MRSLIKAVTYGSLAILIMRGVLWYTERRLTDGTHMLKMEFDNLIHQADSLQELTAVSKDSIETARLKNEQKKVLAVAIEKKKEAISKNEDQIWLLEKMEVITNILMGAIVVSFIVFTVKVRRS